jgi:hypothetical protein
MKFEKDHKANKKLTLLFFIIVIMGIASALARQSKVKQSLAVVELGEGESSAAESTCIEEMRAGPLLHSDWGRDPFVRGVDDRSGPGTGSKGKETLQFTLSGIITDGETSAAVIDGDVYRMGEVVRGFVVQDISSGSVTLRRGEQKLVLVL